MARIGGRPPPGPPNQVWEPQIIPPRPKPTPETAIAKITEEQTKEPVAPPPKAANKRRAKAAKKPPLPRGRPPRNPDKLRQLHEQYPERTNKAMLALYKQETGDTAASLGWVRDRRQEFRRRRKRRK